jgi:hypothetical protein
MNKGIVNLCINPENEKTGSNRNKTQTNEEDQL